jgi:hypothetical protein
MSLHKSQAKNNLQASNKNVGSYIYKGITLQATQVNNHDFQDHRFTNFPNASSIEIRIINSQSQFFKISNQLNTDIDT